MDIRTVATRNKIKLALLNCMKKEAFSDISNKEIIENSEISSRTFYHHYQDKNEILEDIENEIIAGLKKANEEDNKSVLEVDQPLTDEENIFLAEKEFKHLIDYCDSIKEAGNILLSSNGDINFLNKIHKISVDETRKRLTYLFENNYLARSKEAEIPANIVINLYSEMIVSVIITWLQSDTQLSPYEVRKILGLVQIKSPTELLLLLKK